jgi:hypothetical protein
VGILKGNVMVTANSDYAHLITAAHRGNRLAQQALDVIDDARRAVLLSCSENHILPPKQFYMTQMAEVLATGMIKASAWLDGVATQYGQDIRQHTH